MRHRSPRSFRAQLRCALAGLDHALRAERSFRLQLGALAAVLIALLLLRAEALWWALVLAAAALVLAAELFNSAIEALADTLHPQYSAGIRIVKDCAAAGVLIAVLGALAVAGALALHLLVRHA